MILIETLHDVQSLLGRIAETAARIPLKLREVVKTGSVLLLGNLLHRGHGKDFSLELFFQFFRPFLIKGAVASALLILPAPADTGGFQRQAEIFLRHKLFDLLLPSRDHRQRRRLDTAAGKLGVVFAGQGPGGVDTHEPVGLRTGCCRPVKVIILSAIPKVLEALPDGLIRHRRNPEPLDRFLAARDLQNPAGYKLSLPSRICGDDHASDVLPEKKGFHCPELLAGLRDHHQFHFVRHHRESLHLPFHIFLIVGFRVCQRHQMAQCPGDNVVPSFHSTVQFLFTVKDPGNIPGHRRFLCDYQCFHKLPPK